jgi:hypothetical protein
VALPLAAGLAGTPAVRWGVGFSTSTGAGSAAMTVLHAIATIHAIIKKITFVVLICHLFHLFDIHFNAINFL